jgi:hypothetical protein
MGEARRRKVTGNVAPKDPKKKYRGTTPSKHFKYLVYGKKLYIPGIR